MKVRGYTYIRSSTCPGERIIFYITGNKEISHPEQ